MVASAGRCSVKPGSRIMVSTRSRARGRESCGVKQTNPISAGNPGRRHMGSYGCLAVANPLPEDCAPLLAGEVLEGMRPTDKPASGPQNDPKLPVRLDRRHIKAHASSLRRWALHKISKTRAFAGCWLMLRTGHWEWRRKFPGGATFDRLENTNLTPSDSADIPRAESRQGSPLRFLHAYDKFAPYEPCPIPEAVAIPAKTASARAGSAGSGEIVRNISSRKGRGIKPAGLSLFIQSFAPKTQVRGRVDGPASV